MLACNLLLVVQQHSMTGKTLLDYRQILVTSYNGPAVSILSNHVRR